MPKSNRTVKRVLRELIRDTDREFSKHIKKFNCRLDSSGCLDRAQFQERLRTLDEVLVICGGRSMGFADQAR